MGDVGSAKGLRRAAAEKGRVRALAHRDPVATRPDRVGVALGAEATLGTLVEERAQG